MRNPVVAGLSETPIARLSREAVQLDLTAVDAQTRRHATAVIADTVGVMLAGGLVPEVAKMVRRQDEDPLCGMPEGPSQLVTPGQPGTDPTTAAFVNASAGTFLELDEGIRPSGHPGIHVIPAALATAQALGRTGAELLLAVLAGYEVAARLFIAYELRFPVHPHGNLGAVGAAVAVARLRGADPVGPAKIAAALPLLSVWQPAFEGATVRNAFAGVGAAMGVVANRLDAAGFTGSDEALPTAFGEIAGKLVDEEALTAPVRADRLLIDRDYQKQHSACALSHSAIDAVLSLGPVDLESMRAVRVETVDKNLRLDRQSRGNELSNRFSLPYAVAAALVHGEAGPAAFVPDERVAAIAQLVSVEAVDSFTARWPAASPARVEIELADRTLEASVENPIGHETRRLTPQQLREKFETLAADPADGLSRVPYERLLDLERAEDLRALLSR